MRTAVKILGVIHGLQGVAVLGLLATLVVFYTPPPGTEAGLLWFGAALLVGAASLLVAVGIGLWHHRVWARTGAITFAVLSVFTGGGALLALFSFIVLFHPDGRVLFLPDRSGNSVPSLD